MWVYDVETFQFLSVNNAAIVKYGYSLEEFLGMTIKDIRPPEDCAALEENVKAVSEGRDEAGVWRHSLKSGEIIHVDIIGHTVLHHGRPAELISARDVTRHVHAEQRMREALAREQSARRASDALARQFQVMFDNIPGMFLVFSPENFDVIAVSDAYLAAMHIKRADAVGQNLFTILPPQPSDTRHSDLQASFARVMATGNPDLLEIQKFMLPDQNERLWVLTSKPVEGPDQRQLFLILQIQDVTTAIDGQDCGKKASDFEVAKLNLVT
ncbi:PAS domain S-box-containing protein [Salipiger marinus]|uniref:PAS domain S-box-containing protein n=2 Tax=Salipiger marinus TaxID=555512 RepID=A0A1G8M8E2_9RHOB|nr:PAS domain S-box-containing protein [Salipiger marinus]